MTQQTDNTEATLQPGADLDQLIDSCIASRETRFEDWDALAFQADQKGDQFRRAQIRYVGSGATGNFETDNRIIPSRGFTFSNMRLPAGAIGPEHTHSDVEEAFFVLEGQIEVSVHDVADGTKKATRTLGYRDMIVVPAGVPRSLVNPTEEDALFCVVIGTRKPQLPTYPETSDMYGVTR